MEETPETVETPVETPETPEQPTEQPESTGEQKTSPPEEEQPKTVPLKALEDERRKRQSEAEEKEYWKQQAIRNQQPEKREEPTQQVSGLSPKPTREQFYNDPDPEASFIEAMADWKAEEKLAIREQQTRQNEARTRQQTAAEKFFSSGKQKYADFDTVATYNTDLVVTPAMQEALVDSEHGPDVAYYLGQNTAEARRIASLPPVAQIREIGRIEAKLQVAEAPPKRTTQAPEPIKPVEPKGNPGTKDPSQMTDAEFNAWRRRQIAQRR